MAAPLSLQPIAFPPPPHRIPPPAGNLIFAVPQLRLLPLRHTIRTRAKFGKFDGRVEQENNLPATPSELRLPQLLSQAKNQEEEEEDDDDSELPYDLEDSIRQSGRAAAAFVTSGGMRSIVELLIPQLQFLDDEGAQVELWELSRIFLESLMEESGSQKVKAVFPDAGAAALLKYRWKDASFGFSSLNDRNPVDNEDEIVVMVVPDYQMLQNVEKIASKLSDDPPRPLVMWNPRLISEDVGVGINVRRLRRFFLSTFTVVYSMRPFPSGAVFRCYPGLWKVFLDDKDRPGRYLLGKEFLSRPSPEEIENIFGDASENSEQQQSIFAKATSIFSSLAKFMKVISS